MPKNFFVLALLLISNLTLASDDKPQAESVSIIQRAVERTDIFSLPSFTIKASVKLNVHDKSLDGTYLLYWNGPDQWKDDVELPGYSEVQIGSKGSVYRKRSTDLIPPAIAELRSTLGFGASPLLSRNASFRWPTLRKGETIKKVQNRKIAGTNAKCVEILDPTKYEREVCVDEATNNLLRIKPFEDSQFLSIGDKVFPRSLSWVEDGKTHVAVRIDELTPGTQFPPNVFDVPEGANPKPGCMNPMPPEIVKKVQPQYPEADRLGRAQGDVYVSAIIGLDGVPSQLKIVSGVSSGLNQESLNSIKSWRYEPAQCGDTPIETENLLRVIFSLTYGSYFHSHN